MASMFDAHDRAFAFFKGTCTRGIYDNMKTAVEAVFIGNPPCQGSCPLLYFSSISQVGGIGR